MNLGNTMKFNMLFVLVGLVSVSSTNAMDMSSREFKKQQKLVMKKVQKEENERIAKENKKKAMQQKREKEKADAKVAADQKQAELNTKFKAIDSEKPPFIKVRVKPEPTIAEKNRKLKEKHELQQVKKITQQNSIIETTTIEAPQIHVIETPNILPANVTSIKTVKKTKQSEDPNADWNPETSNHPGKNWIPNRVTR